MEGRDRREKMEKKRWTKEEIGERERRHGETHKGERWRGRDM